MQAAKVSLLSDSILADIFGEIAAELPPASLLRGGG